MPGKLQLQSTLRIVNRAELATVFGVHVTTVDSWVRAGCPNVEKGGHGIEWKFDISAISKWHVERAVAAATGTEKADSEELKRRKLEAETEMVELALAKEKGEVALISDFSEAQAKLFAILRTNIMNVAQRVTLRLIGETNEQTFKKILKDELALALKETANAALTISPEEKESND